MGFQLPNLNWWSPDLWLPPTVCNNPTTPRISTRFPASGRGCKKKRSHSPPPRGPKKMSKKSLKQIPNGRFFPQQQNAMGSLHYIDLGVFWASWGGSGKELGSRNRFWVTGLAVPGNHQEPDPGFDGFWGQKVACPRVRRFWCSMGSDGLGSVPEVWTEPALGTRFRKPEVLRRFWVPEILFPRFRKLLYTLKVLLLYLESILLYFENMLLYFEVSFCICTSKVYFCTLKVYFCTLKVCFCTLKVYFCTLKVYFCTLKVCFCTLKVYFCSLKVYFCTLKVYFCTLKVYFCTLKVYFCTLPQCLLQVAWKINTARAKKRW